MAHGDQVRALKEQASLPFPQAARAPVRPVALGDGVWGAESGRPGSLTRYVLAQLADALADAREARSSADASEAARRRLVEELGALRACVDPVQVRRCRQRRLGRSPSLCALRHAGTLLLRVGCDGAGAPSLRD
jgi:hypothetical protein